jgi:hypothetical protein
MNNSTDESFFIYAIMLEHEYILLHASLKSDVTEVKNECEQMYEMAKLHRPIAILDMICHTKDLSLLDYYVKKYMLKYGIFYVRGGSYYEPTLPDYLSKSLEREFKTLDCYKKNYKNPPSLVPTKSPEYSLEYIELNEKYRCVREIEDMDGNTSYITRDIIKKFEWISDKIHFVRNANLNLIDYEMKNSIIFHKKNEGGSVSYFDFNEFYQSIYDSVVYNIKKIIEKFFVIHQDNPYKMYENENKKTIIDYDLKVLSNYDSNQINELLKNTEFFIYSVINHLEELEFNLSTLL